MKGKILAGIAAGVGVPKRIPTSILTVADDLLNNDGRKFLKMMEELTEQRLVREEEAAGRGVSEDEDDSSSVYGDGNSDGQDEDGSKGDEEDESGEKFEFEFNVSLGDTPSPSYRRDEDEGGEEDKDDDDEVMTEEQKLEEGKRMFSIFAARMFEQRVLKAYREREREKK
ncbi:hypothetical protein B0H14DRAFT_2964925 [Mycena olivaceomarginata]|nr:hypothetical protein B0H14DRAFT_2964925 [Mycena olivaceomarginata]